MICSTTVTDDSDAEKMSKVGGVVEVNTNLGTIEGKIVMQNVLGTLVCQRSDFL